MKKCSMGFIAGFVLAALLSGGTAAVAASVVANLTTSQVLVNGSPIKAEAYNIGGNNYFKLRDLAAALDFSVVYDSVADQVLIDTSRGYGPNETLPIATPAPLQSEVPAMTIDEMKAEIIRLTNVERVKAGVPELEVLPALMDCAQAKADDFIDNHYFGHTSPVYGTAGEMIRSYVKNTKGIGENLATWTTSPEQTVSGWMGSSGHRDNILETRFTHIGVGIVEGTNGGYAWVQHFTSVGK